MAGDFPKRWHVEEFFNAHQALGWDRAGTCNLNIRYGQMTMALIAQAAIAQLRKRLASPATDWDARHMATAYFEGLEGDVRVDGDTIVVTVLQRPRCGQTARALRGLAGEAAVREDRPAGPLALRVHG